MIEGWSIEQNKDTSMDIKTLYKDEHITLQLLIIKVGSCKMFKFREIYTDEFGDLGVNEVKEAPVWFIRLKKLKALGI